MGVSTGIRWGITVNKIVIAVCLVAVVLFISGCCGCFRSGTTTTSENAANIDDQLVGAWGDLGPIGDIVDAGGNYAGDVYSGEAYHFYRNGTYSYDIIGSGTVIRALIVQKGNYRVSSDKLYLYNIREDLYPFAGDQHQPERNKQVEDQTYTYSFEDDGNRLSLLEKGMTAPFYYNRQ